MVKGNREMPVWFKKMFEEAKEASGNLTNLSKDLELTRSTVQGWEEGSIPGIDCLEGVLKRIGGDISRALPTYEPPHGRATIATIAGSVSAGTVDLAEENREEIEIGPSLWQESHWAPYAAAGPITMIRTRGDSMEPTYPNGTLLVCKPPRNSRELPDGAPCIFEAENDKATFKLLRRTKEGVILGQPINPRRSVVVFSSSSDLRIRYIVLGSIDPGKERRF